LPGRVWKSLKHEWCPNVQFLPKVLYHRKYLAINNGIKACLGVAHIVNGEFLGVMEFFLSKRAREDKKIV